jgi:hypothetical protein
VIAFPTVYGPLQPLCAGSLETPEIASTSMMSVIAV